MLKQLGGSNPPQVTADVIEKLRVYQWPGNVRQLRNCLERAVLLSNEGVITANELPPEIARMNGSMAFVPVQTPLATGVALAGDPTTNANTGSLRDIEKQQIIAALEKTGWHRGKAAEMLGISPSTLYRRLRDYNLEGRLR
jgi:DNA-binding NtrC family response regulator